MTHAFLLLVYLGVGDYRQLISETMYFRSVTECNFFASELSKRFGNYRYYSFVDSRDKVTAYCVPRLVDESSVEIY